MRDLLFWCLMYLYHEVICLYRCLYGNRCICTDLIFAVVDAFVVIVVSTHLAYSLSQIPFLNICDNRFSGIEDAKF